MGGCKPGLPEEVEPPGEVVDEFASPAGLAVWSEGSPKCRGDSLVTFLSRDKKVTRPPGRDPALAERKPIDAIFGLSPIKSHPMRTIVTLECTTCKERNYSTTRNKKKTQDKLARSKFCPRCRKHSAHKEAK